MNANDMSLELASRRAKAQSYFDRYPERKGQGPYVPNATLLTPVRGSSRTSSARSSSSETGISSPPAKGNDDRQQRRADELGVSPSEQRIRRFKDEGDDRTLKQWHNRGEQDDPSVSREIINKSSTSSYSSTKRTATTTQPLEERQSSAFAQPISLTSAGFKPSLRPTGIDESPFGSSEANKGSLRSTIEPLQRSTKTPNEPLQNRASRSIRSSNDSSMNLHSNQSRASRTDQRSLRELRELKARSRNNESIEAPTNISRPYGTETQAKSKAAAVGLQETNGGNRPSVNVQARQTSDLLTANAHPANGSVLSIDEIIRKHSISSNDASISSTSMSSRSNSRSSLILRSRMSDASEYFASSPTALSPNRTNADQESDVLEDGSDTSSLDSVEREVRQSLKVSTPEKSHATPTPSFRATFGSGSERSKKCQDAESDDFWKKKAQSHIMTQSTSAPALLHKKSTPNMPLTLRSTAKGNRPPVPLREQSKHESHRSVSSNASVAQVAAGAPMPITQKYLPRSKSSANIVVTDTDWRIGQQYRETSSPVPSLPSMLQTRATSFATPQKQRELRSCSPDVSFNDESSSIREYVQSARLTRLMTLQRPPYLGKTVSLADVGDANGHAVFLFMGLGAVRYLVGLYDEMATALGLRIICIDRWGMGKTDNVPSEKRGVLEWSNVVSEVADRLGIQTFSLLAHSAGAPYAMGTCLALDHRIVGPVHLLAPWVGPTVESGYKWLRYVPDGIIRTAQAADWHMQGWKLGASSKSFTDASSNGGEMQPDQYALPSGSVADSPRLGGAPSEQSKSRRVARARYSFEPSSQVKNAEENRSVQYARRTPSMGNSISSLADDFDLLQSWHARSPSDASRSSSPPPVPPKTPMNGKVASYAHTHTASVTSHTPSFTLEPPTSPTGSSSKGTSPQQQQQQQQNTSDLPTELLRASHAESGGSASDLLVILGRSSQKPWGFTYIDVHHPVRVWHGEKDERVSLSSVLWMERELDDCHVKIIKGANHGLLTNVAVVVEALEHIASHATVS